MSSTTRYAMVALGLAISALPLFACGDVAPIPGIAPDVAPQKLAQAICPKAYECCMTDQLSGNMQAGTDVASCEMKTQEAFERQVDSIKASEKKGRVKYDGLAVQACVEHLTDPKLKCDELNKTNHFSGVPGCSSFIVPKVAPGAACAFDWECIDGACDKSAVPAGSSGDGVCKAFAKSGESCSATALCAKDLTCDAASMTCKAATPAPPPANACFYSSACNFTGGDRGAASLVTVMLLLLAIGLRRRAVG